jgi:predicted enzyme related to lactoylglutathione lyase
MLRTWRLPRGILPAPESDPTPADRTNHHVDEGEDMTNQAAAGTTATCTYTPGAFVWHELQTKDVAKAATFYTELLGWTVKAVEMGGGMTYHLIHVGEKQIGGMWQSDAVPPLSYWGGYVSVPDVDKAAATAAAEGGRIVAGPADIPNVGRFAACIDPQGAALSLFKSSHGDPDTTGAPAPGEFCWDNLGTTDVAAATAFYGKVIGWTAADGDVFKYGDLAEASFGVAPEGVPASWLTHIFVPKLADTVRKAESLGATVLMADVAISEWGRFSVIQDPAGAVISLFEGNDA